MNIEPTNGEILQAIKAVETGLGGRIDGLGDRIDQGLAKTNERIDDVLEAVSEFSTRVDQRFEKVESDIGGMKSDIVGMKTDIVDIKSQMVTKTYLDNKLADLRTDLVYMARKGNQKLTELVEQLTQQGVLTHDIARRILAMEPFPQM